MSQDEQHLNLLAIFHFILGGMIALFACFPMIHMVVGILMLSGMLDGEDAPPRALGILLIAIPAVFIFAGWVIAALVIVAGRKLRRRASWTFCMIVAGLECLFMPFGTALGVFTIVVLSRVSIKELFESSGDAPEMP
jgi:thiol:disulfide interchange protein